MIKTQITNDNPSNLAGYEDRMVGLAVVVPTSGITKTVNISIPEECCDCLEVFGGGTGLQNDKSSFLFKRLTSSDTIEYKLLKDDVQVASLNNNFLGTFYDFGTWTAVRGQEQYKGFVVDWNLVHSAHGTGSYVIRAEHNVLGSSYNMDSDQYDLRLYNDYYANESVVFQWSQNGRIRNSEYDFTDMEWVQYVRVKGIFGTWTPTLETDTVVYSNYLKKQVQDQILNSYTFQSKLIEYKLTKMLILDLMLGTDIMITDFNLYNHRDDYVQLKVRQSEIPSLEELGGSKKAVLELKFTDLFDDTIKQGN